MAKKKQQSVKTRRQAETATPELVTWALHGIQQAISAARARVEDLEAQARKLRAATRAAVTAAAETFSTEKEPTAAKPKTVRKKRKLSADARRRIADAQKRRWAKARASQANS